MTEEKTKLEAAEQRNVSLAAEVSDLNRQVADLKMLLGEEQQLVRSLEALYQNDELIIKQQESVITSLNNQLAVASKLARQQFDKYIRPFLDAGTQYYEEANASYGRFGWFHPLSYRDKVRWGLGPLPSDYGCNDWYANNAKTLGYRCIDLLFCVPGWDNDEREGLRRYPITAYPSWAYTTYDPDPPRPQSYCTGIAENTFIGEYPKSWKVRPAKNGATCYSPVCR